MSSSTRTRFQHLFARSALLTAGMFLASLGIAFTTVADIGTTPISTVPYTASAISGLTFGTCTILLNFFFVAGQILVLGRRWPVTNLIQLPVGCVFGFFIDLSMHLLSGVHPANWPLALLLSVFGNLVLALGIVMQIRSKTIVQPGEGFVIAVAARFKSSFGAMKIANDLTLAAVAAALGLCAVGHVIGIREGTLVSAVMIGLFAKWIDRLANRFVSSRSAEVEEPREVDLCARATPKEPAADASQSARQESGLEA